MRLRAAESPELEDLCARLNEVAIDGIEFFDYQVLGPRDAALNRVIDEADYVAALSRQELADLGIEDDALGDLLRVRPSVLTIDREIRGIKKRVDVAAALVDVAVGEGGEALDAAGLTGDLLPIRITLRIGGKTTPRPAEALRALSGLDALSPRVVRSGFFARRQAGRVAPLQLELLRAKSSLEAAE